MHPQHFSLIKELRFLQLTIYVLVFLFAFPFFGQEWIFKLFSSIFLLNGLLVSLSASGRNLRIKWLFWLIFGASVVFIFLYLTPRFAANRLLFLQLAIFFEILLMLLCLSAVLIYIFASSEVTLDTIFAAVVGYLMIAFTFSQGYMLLFSVRPESFNLSIPASPVAMEIFHGDMIYYSLIVITTVGMGDILPLTPAARILTAIEAMVGQFYVVILVAWLVGRFISKSSGHRPTAP